MRVLVIPLTGCGQVHVDRPVDIDGVGPRGGRSLLVVVAPAARRGAMTSWAARLGLVGTLRRNTTVGRW